MITAAQPDVCDPVVSLEWIRRTGPTRTLQAIPSVRRRQNRIAPKWKTGQAEKTTEIFDWVVFHPNRVHITVPLLENPMSNESEHASLVHCPHCGHWLWEGTHHCPGCCYQFRRGPIEHALRRTSKHIANLPYVAMGAGIMTLAPYAPKACRMECWPTDPLSIVGIGRRARAAPHRSHEPGGEQRLQREGVHSAVHGTAGLLWDGDGEDPARGRPMRTET